MAKQVFSRALGAVLVLTLAGCSFNPDLGRLNPATWFGDEAEEVAETQEPEVFIPPSDSRDLVSQVTSAELEPTRFGVILRAKGALAYPQTARPALRVRGLSRPDSEGVLRFDMVGSRLVAPGKAFSLNELIFGEERGVFRVDSNLVPVEAATFISDSALRDTRQIVISAQDGSITLPVR